MTKKANVLGKPANSRVKLMKGFRLMDPARQREIAALGGRTAHAKGTAHQFTSETASLAGKKAHHAKRVNPRAVLEGTPDYPRRK